MPGKNPNVPLSARIAAGLWLVLLMFFWVIEGGFRPWSHAAEGIASWPWWSGETIRKAESDFEDQLTGFQKVRPYYNWATFWAFGQSDGLVVRGKNGFMFYRAMLTEVPEEDDHSNEYLELFRQLKLAYEEAGCDIYWLLIPEKAMVYPQNLYGAQDIVTRRKAKVRELVAKMERLNFKVIDLPKAFFEDQDPNNLLFLPDDTHWTERGKQVAVDLAVHAIRENQSLTGHASKVTSKVFQRHSDLPRLVNFPMTLRRRFHVHDIVKTSIEGDGAADVIVFGTSFSHGFDLPQAIGAQLNAIPEDHALNSITVPDLLMSAMSRLQTPTPIKPGTPVIIELPYRLLLRTEGLREIKQQFQWLNSPSFKPAQVTLDPRQLEFRNLNPGKRWVSTNDDPQILVNLDQIAELQAPNFIALRIKFDQRIKRDSKCTIFYDMGDGFNKAQSYPFTLNVTPSWQTWLIPIRFKRRMPAALRIDPVNFKTTFHLGAITIH